MIIIYHCYGGTHSSVMAASLHLGLLPQDKKPTGKELLALPYFDQQSGADFGKIFIWAKMKEAMKYLLWAVKTPVIL